MSNCTVGKQLSCHVNLSSVFFHYSKVKNPSPMAQLCGNKSKGPLCHSWGPSASVQTGLHLVKGLATHLHHLGPIQRTAPRHGRAKGDSVAVRGSHPCGRSPGTASASLSLRTTP